MEPGPGSPAGPERRPGGYVRAATSGSALPVAGARRHCPGARRELHHRARGSGGTAAPGRRGAGIAVRRPPLRPQHPRKHRRRGSGLDGASACACPAGLPGHPDRRVRAAATARGGPPPIRPPPPWPRSASFQRGRSPFTSTSTSWTSSMPRWRRTPTAVTRALPSTRSPRRSRRRREISGCERCRSESSTRPAAPGTLTRFPASSPASHAYSQPRPTESGQLVGRDSGREDKPYRLHSQRRRIPSRCATEAGPAPRPPLYGINRLVAEARLDA